MKRKHAFTILASLLILLCCQNPTNDSVSKGSELYSTVSFSPLTDRIDKFAFPPNFTPTLVILDEASIETGTAHMLVLPDGKTSGRLEWEFCVPRGKNNFSDLSIYIFPYADYRSSATAYEQVNLINPDNVADSLMVINKYPNQNPISASSHAIKSWINGRTKFILCFYINNPDAKTSQLHRIFIQFMRQDITDGIPFQMTPSFN